MVPECLRERRQWVCHTREKVPLRPWDGGSASVSDPRSWGTFEQAEARAKHQRLGIGFVFSQADDFAGVDLDGVRNPLSGQFADWVDEVVEEFASYTEVSPSGRGLHIILRARGLSVRGGAFRFEGTHKVEVYASGRYFTVTGRRVLGGGTSPQVEDARDALRAFLSRCDPVGRVGSSRVGGGRRYKANLAVLEELFSRLGVDVRGGKARCPFHDDTEPSLIVDENGFRCFSTHCGLGGGGAVKLRRAIARLTDEELTRMAERSGAKLEQLVKLSDELCEAFGWLSRDTLRSEREDRN